MSMESRSNRLRRTLAEQCHKSWAGWMKYLFSRSSRNQGSISKFVSLEFTREDVMRWDRQMEASYQHLSDKEKDSDLREADNYLKLVLKYIRMHGLPEFIGNLADEASAMGEKKLSSYLHESRRKFEGRA